jgi:ATP-dependent Lon protease
MSNHKIHTIDNLSLQEYDWSWINTIVDLEDEEEMINEELPDSLPILPLRNMVYFRVVILILVEINPLSWLMTQMEDNRVVAQKKSQTENPPKRTSTQLEPARILRNAWWEYYRNSSRENVLKLNRLLLKILILLPVLRFSWKQTWTSRHWIFSNSWIYKRIIINKRKPKHSYTEATFAIKNIESQSWSILLLQTWIYLLKKTRFVSD